MRTDGALEPDGPVGIGGWLAVLVTEFVVMALFTGFTFIVNFLPSGLVGAFVLPYAELVNPEDYETIAKAASLMVASSFGYTALVSIVLFSLAVLHHRWFPRLLIVGVTIGVALLIVSVLLIQQIPGYSFGNSVRLSAWLVFSILPFIIWIPYVLLSKRVKNTFVK